MAIARPVLTRIDDDGMVAQINVRYRMVTRRLLIFHESDGTGSTCYTFLDATGLPAEPVRVVGDRLLALTTAIRAIRTELDRQAGMATPATLD